MKLWLDDERPMPADYDVWVRTAETAITSLRTGLVTHISLDHDLGAEKTGYDVAKFIEEGAYHGTLAPLTAVVHSANAVGRKNIQSAIHRAHTFWSRS
jgi:hypothetical protein